MDNLCHNTKMNDKTPPQSLSLHVPDLKAGLYLVATPIGNLKDVSLRALETLMAVDVIACEDTRISRKFLSAYDISKKLIPYHDHSKQSDRDKIMAAIRNGESVALISDAGMPLVSDPGYKLVTACREAGLYVTTLPGANAPLSALQLSGLPSDQFSFLGFLPSKTTARKKQLQHWCDVQSSLILFESASRLLASLSDIQTVLGDRDVAVVREITKMFEETRADKVSALIAHYQKEGAPKGEIVIVIGPPEEKTYSEDEIKALLSEQMGEHATKKAAKIVAEQTGRSVSELYDVALSLRE